jgi:hypothetical protein
MIGELRPFLLPMVTFIVIAFVFFVRPEITGFIVSSPGRTEKILGAKIRVSIAKGGLIPEGSVITIYLNGQNSSLPIRDFMLKSGRIYNYTYGTLPQINYRGYGYSGEHTYSLDISEFGLNTNLKPGNYTLMTEISYENFVISHTMQNIIIE